MAARQTQCGKDSCQCSFLFFDLDLSKEWLNTAREFFELAKKPLKDVILRQLFLPCKLNTLCEHETCFQQWCVLQLWVGFISTIWIFTLSFIWALTEDLVPMGPVFVNAMFALFLIVFMTHLAWFDVMKKQGCCCFVLCCCVGKPNLLATAILAVVFGVVSLLQGFQALGSGFVLPMLAAISALAHGVVLLYLGFEAFMVWKFSISITTPEKPVVGAAQNVAHASVDLEANQAQVKPVVMLGRESGDGIAVTAEKEAVKTNTQA